jgi:spore germination protein KC
VDNVLRFTFQIPSFKKEGAGSGDITTGQGSGQKDYESVSIDAPTLYTGLNMVEAGLSRRLNYMHAKYVVISEELAREGVERFINGMVRSRQIRRIMYIIIVKGTASKFIENFRPKLTAAFSKAQEGFIDTGREDTGFIIGTNYHNFVKDLKTTYRMPAAPLAAINDFSNYKESGNPPPAEEFVAGGKFKAGEIPRKGGNNFEFFGTALFDGDKMVGELNGIQTRMLLMTRGEFNRCAMSMQDPLNKKLRISIDTKQQKKPEIKVDISGQKPVVNVKIFLEGDLQNVQNPIEYESVKTKPIIEKNFKEDMRGYLDETIKICQNLNVDVFGFGEKAVGHFLTIQEWEAYNWLSRFKDAEINTEFEFTIRRTGTLLKTNPSRDSEEEQK